MDAYLQLKTSASEQLRGRIMIDSPGFDADSQRNATLRLTSHIIDLSDLVLVFFDARHPEPGAMRDTLAHLVGQTIKRPGSRSASANWYRKVSTAWFATWARTASRCWLPAT